MTVQDWIQKQQTAPAPTQPALPAAQPSGPGFIGNVKSDFKKTVSAGLNTEEEGESGKINKPSEYLQEAGEVAGGISDVAGDALGAVGKKIPVNTSSPKPDYAAPSLPALQSSDGSSPTNLTDAFTAMMQGLGKTVPAQYIAQKVSDFSQRHPEASADLGAIINIASILPEGEAAKAVGEGAIDAAKGTAEAVGKTGETIDKAKIAASSGGRIPTLDSAATRVANKPVLPEAGKDAAEVVGEKTEDDASGALPMKQGIGKSGVQDPAALHAKYYTQEQKALADTKEDTALGMVGSDLGKSFDQVVKLRQKVGKTMSDELDKFGGNKISSSGIVSGFQKDLIDSGAKYDAVKQEVVNTADSKFSSTDTKLLEKYGQEISKLGKNPTAKSLDAFVGRMPNEIKALKSQAGINFKTNAERIINKNLDSVRSTLTGAGTPAYKAARSNYSDLSNFVNEGVPFLGKKTSTGDFAKDASLVKSSVQSALNGGKKDWLMKLEKLTGNPIIDKATLALQAMKDAGDYRGASLLQSLTEGASSGKIPEIPTTATGMANALAGKAIKKGAEKFIGTPYEQTQRFLKSLSKK